MIEIKVLRVAKCEVCCSTKVLWPEEPVPETCWHCRTRYWQYGPPDLAMAQRRRGYRSKETVVNREHDGRLREVLGRFRE